MKKLTKFFALSIVMVSFAATTFAQVSATATATAVILTPITIAKTVDMNFGYLAVNTSLGTVVLGTNNSRTPSGGVTLMVGGPVVSAASFTVTGLPGATYSISLPASIVLTDGTNNMTVNSIISSPTPTGTLTGGTQTLLVGATLNVSASQQANSYTNTTDLTVTVNYN